MIETDRNSLCEASRLSSHQKHVRSTWGHRTAGAVSAKTKEPDPIVAVIWPLTITTLQLRVLDIKLAKVQYTSGVPGEADKN